MRTGFALLFALGLVFPLIHCGSSDDTTGGTTTTTHPTTTTHTSTGGTGPQGGGGSGATGNTGGTTSQGGGGEGGTVPMPDLYFGDACHCEGNGCQQAGVPKPASPTIVGCDNVPANVTGAALVCLQTYTGSLATNTYFANGYCGLQATTCTGASLICSSAVWGDYPNMTSCPAGTALLTDSVDVTVFGQNATIQTKVCARGCTGAGQCREAETDPADNDSATQYQCMDKGGVKFCYDPRDLGPNYTAVAF